MRRGSAWRESCPYPSRTSTSGQAHGKVTLDYSFGAMQGGWTYLANGTYSCDSAAKCTINATLTRPGQPSTILGVLTGLLTPEQQTTLDNIMLINALLTND